MDRVEAERWQAIRQLSIKTMQTEEEDSRAWIFAKEILGILDGAYGENFTPTSIDD